jgi:hypothetical protein
MQALAEQAVAAFAGLGTGRLAGSERYYRYRVLRQLDVSELLLRAMRLGEQADLPGLERRHRSPAHCWVTGGAALE